MVIPLRFLLTLLAVMPALLHAANLSIETETRQVEMGKYLGIRIVHTGEQSPGSADLRQWQDDFHVDRRGSEVDTLSDGQIQSIERLRLYPKRTGELLLESIALGGAIASPVRIQSQPTVRDGIDGTPAWQGLPKQVWQGQAFEVAIDMNLLHPSNHMAVEEMVGPDWVIQELPRIEEADKQGKTITLHWRLLSHGSGHLTINAPPIEQRGRGRWRFYLPSPVVEVLPLPSYIPPTVPVGGIKLSPSLTEQSGTRYWQLQVSGEGELPDAIHGLRHQLATIAGVETDQVTIRSPNTSKGGETLVYHVPLPEWSWGFGKGPKISVDYFDTNSGRLALGETHLPAIWQAPYFAQGLLALLGLALAAAVAVAAKQLISELIDKRRFARQLQCVDNPEQLRTLLLSTSKTRNLAEWGDSMSTNAHAKFVRQLNHACFHPVVRPQAELSHLKDTLRKLT